MHEKVIADDSTAALFEQIDTESNTLLRQITELSQALATAHQALELQQQRLYATESSLEQKTQEIEVVQAQVKHLCQELETSHQNIQCQQILIETLTVQLESSQERVADLEREFAFNQQRYNEQSYQLVQAENSCKELRVRLGRQQSQTLQLKFALEKCLEVSLPSYSSPTVPETFVTTSTESFDDLKDAPELSLLFSSSQPITPWSTTDFEHGQSPWDVKVSSCCEWSEVAVDEEIQSMPLMIDNLSSIGVEADESDIGKAERPQDRDLIDLFDVVGEELAINPSPTLLAQDNHSQISANWPSPVVYPCRPPKGRKSFAAVELPSFV